MKKTLVFIGLLMSSTVLISCGNDDLSNEVNPKNSNLSSSDSTTNVSVSASSTRAEKSLQTLHINNKNSLYGYTIKSRKGKTVIIHTVDCMGRFKMVYSTKGKALTFMGMQGDTIEVGNKSVRFKTVDRNGEERKDSFIFKNNTQNIVVGQTNYDGITEFNVTSITKDSLCN